LELETSVLVSIDVVTPLCRRKVLSSEVILMHVIAVRRRQKCTAPHRNVATVLSTTALLFATISTGCVGSQFAPTPSCSAASFDNQTNGVATNFQLQTIWQEAQQDLATQPIPLNPVAALMNGATLQTIAQDTRAEGVLPKCIAVIAVPDLTVAQLQAENPNVALQHTPIPQDHSLPRRCFSQILPFVYRQQ
jgi:hypothetical protein